MATLYLICGLPGAGKTTLARQIETERSALRLSPDEWIARIIKDPSDRSELDRLRSPVETVQWDLALRILSLGIDVILEWGFWSRQERLWYRREAEAMGARVDVHYLQPDRDELWQRVSKRNANLPPGTFTITEEELDLWCSWWEPPLSDELALNDR